MKNARELCWKEGSKDLTMAQDAALRGDTSTMEIYLRSADHFLCGATSGEEASQKGLRDIVTRQMQAIAEQGDAVLTAIAHIKDAYDLAQDAKGLRVQERFSGAGTFEREAYFSLGNALEVLNKAGIPQELTINYKGKEIGISGIVDLIEHED